MARFINRGTSDIHHYFPAGHPDSLAVSPGQVVDVGDIPVEESGDCYLVGSGDQVRAWPKSRWELETVKPTRAPKPVPVVNPEG